MKRLFVEKALCESILYSKILANFLQYRHSGWPLTTCRLSCVSSGRVAKVLRTGGKLIAREEADKASLKKTDMTRLVHSRTNN